MRDYFTRFGLFLRRRWAWFVRAALAWVILTALAPPRERAILGTPQAVETSKPQVCVHTRLIDEVPEWVIQKSLASVREMGADTIVEFFPWAYIEGEPGRYNWAQTDLILKHAQNQGIKVIARMGLVPDWARPDPAKKPTTLNFLPDNAYDSFSDFVATFAGRYSGQIDQIIIWNEPNLSFEWGYRSADPTAYARLLRETYPRVKAASPSTQVVLAGLAPTIEPEGSPHGLNDLLFLEALYENGAKNFFDAVAMHTYGFNDSPQAEPDFELLNFRRAELHHAIMQRYGDGDKPVYITEFGWNDHPRWTKAVRASLRAAYTVEAYEYAEQNWPWVDKLCVWALRYPRPTYSYPDNFTLITPDFQYKPIYYAIQAYARGWQPETHLWLDAPDGDDTDE